MPWSRLDPWRPCECVTATGPALYSPAQLLCTRPVASFTESVRLIFGLPLFLLPSVFPAYSLFRRPLPSCDVPEIGQLRLCPFASSMFQTAFALGPAKDYVF